MVFSSLSVYCQNVKNTCQNNKILLKDIKNLKNRNGDVYYVHEWKDSISTLSNCLRGSFNMPVRKHMQGYSLKHWL